MSLSKPSQETVYNSPGKWILAGEHAVLRGAPALVFPLRSKSFTLKYEKKETPLELSLGGEYGPEFQVLFWSLMGRACELTGKRKSDLKGKVTIASEIPVGSGLGASAALCASVGRWMKDLEFLAQENVYTFSKNLEDIFHGESSGVDVAVALKGEPLRFLRKGDRQKVSMNWQPKLFLSYSGKKGSTLDCVQKVKALIEKDPELGQRIDQDMVEAVLKAERALNLGSEKGLPLLVEAMELAASCFTRWNLSEESEMARLKSAGARAVKPTGSGGGGFLLSLWDQKPPAEIAKDLIDCF
jgi:mevalonate kinase